MLIEFPKDILERLSQTGVVAGFSVRDVRHAVPVVKALLSGGIDAIELTLRTPAGMEALRSICQQAPEMLVGVGTILTPDMAKEAKALGANFGVSPGLNPNVVRAAQVADLPFAPGVATPTELEAALGLGCRLVKLFPAEPLGGTDYVQSIAAPYKHLGVRFFPLGGVNAENMMDYLKIPSVLAVGGSWIVQDELVENKDWEGISARAREVRNALDGNTSLERQLASLP
jgi:2-dehydro-3-deoxyphosphogluconate aldolase/(4S)-4-hydroxy-2-oxoglutarate aldolase